MKIKDKTQALNLLDQFILQVNEILYFSNEVEKKFFIIARNNLIMMKNSINHSEDFFNSFFKNKTEKEVKKWIEKEAEKW